MTPSADRYPMPSATRVMGGLLVAGSLPGLLVGLLELFGGTAKNALGFGAFLGVFYGVAPALFFGLPAVYALQRVVRPNLTNAVLAGAAVASAPVILASLVISLRLSLALFVSVPLGAIGGAAFWLIALRNLRPISERDPPPQAGKGVGGTAL